jgi:ABC-type multidrug transport system ATPase subunit
MRVIVGLYTADEGSIEVLGHDPTSRQVALIHSHTQDCQRYKILAEHCQHIDTNFHRVFRRIPGGTIGYVPQPLGLHVSLTVREHLALYARVSGMSWRAIDAKIQEFNTRLGLPENHLLIGSLGFGHQKLISVCAALITSPVLAGEHLPCYKG